MSRILKNIYYHRLKITPQTFAEQLLLTYNIKYIGNSKDIIGQLQKNLTNE